MTDNNPFLFVHLPLNEIRGDRLLDASPNRRHAVAHHPKISADQTFGSCLDLSDGQGSFVEFLPWKLNPEVFLRPSESHPLTLTFTVWLLAAEGEGESTLIDCGVRPDLQRLQVRFKRVHVNATNETLLFTLVAPIATGHSWTGEANVPAGQWLHFALVWDPKPGSFYYLHGNCRMFLNGRVVGTAGRTYSDQPAQVSGAPSFQTFLGRPSCRGKLAHFRIYTRELKEEELARDIERDLERLRMASPLDCSLLDPLNKPRMYLDLSDVGEKMQVVVKPLKGGLTLAGLPAGPPTPGRCHFELAFRPGILDLAENRDIAANTRDGPGSWEAKAYPRTSADGHDSICIRCNSARSLDSGELKVVLNALKADRRFGPRSTLVQIRYRNLRDGDGQLLSGRIQQWLQLEPRVPRRGLSMGTQAMGAAWRQDPADSGAGPLRVSEGRIQLIGHFFCGDAQEQMKKSGGWQILTTLPSDLAPFGGKEMRFPGRVHWLSLSSSAPKTLWWSDLIVGPQGVVSISTDLPREVLAAVGRIDVFLDGVSYSDENLWVVR